MTKRALVLSGGGSKGAYQAGAIDFMLGSDRVQYDLYAGVSVGALNASYLAMFKRGDEAQAAAELTEIWKTIRTRDVRRGGFVRALAGLLWRPSFYSSRPLMRFVRDRVRADRIRASGRELIVGAVSLVDGRFKRFTHASANIVDGVLASSAFPAMLEPVRIGEDLHTDGGVRDVTPLAAAIEAGATHADVILVEPGDLETSYTFRDGRPSGLTLALRSIEIMIGEIIANDIKTCHRINQLVDEGRLPEKRRIELRILRPEKPLAYNPLKFEKDDLEKAFRTGRADAERGAWHAP